MPSVPLRKDSARTRESILRAAEDLLETDADASFAQISIAAEVSQATVYRHFADRSELLIGLMERSLAEIEAEVAGWEPAPDTMEALLRLMSTHQARYQGVLSAVRRGEVDGTRLAEMEARTLDVFRKPFNTAKRAGRVRKGVVLKDVIPLLAMVDGAIAVFTDRRDRDRAAALAVEVVCRGIAGSG
jgi:AcrR family transcriptional regulator